MRVYVRPRCLAIGRTRVSDIARSILEPACIGMPRSPRRRRTPRATDFQGNGRERTERAMWRRNTSMPLRDGICNGDDNVNEREKMTAG